MGDAENDRVPAACSLEPAARASRRERWLRLADRSLVAKQATPTGARLVYRRAGETETELAELAAAEAECCGFADWRVRRSAADLVTLEVETGPDSVAVVHAMFELEKQTA